MCTYPLQFTINLHYDVGPSHQYPITAILRSHPLSVRSPQARFIVRGTKGTYIKHGLDVQEDQLKVMASPKAILEQGYGMEPEYIWGNIENIEADEATVTNTRYV